MPTRNYEVSEPGATVLGEDIRSILLSNKHSIAPTAELLLFNAARAQVVEQVIIPALERGEIVRRCNPVIGYLHTGMEKTAETKTYLQALTNTVFVIAGTILVARAGSSPRGRPTASSSSRMAIPTSKISCAESSARRFRTRRDERP